MERSLMRMDLNLLKALHILLQERNVSRAADRLFVTPSAMSKTLHRLREALNDPLLVRTQRGLVPTPRAEQLQLLLQNAFVHLEGCLLAGGFEPREATGSLRIAAPETFAIGVVPDLIPVLHAEAPKLHIESLHLGDGYLDALADGSLDFVIYLDQEYPEGFVTHPLFTATPRIWCRNDHPITRIDAPTLQDICGHPIVVFHSPSIKTEQMRAIVEALEMAGLRRDVMFETSHLLAALVMISQSNAIMVAADYLFEYPMFNSKVTSLAVDHIPLFDDLRIDLCLIQHERTESSPLHEWVVARTVGVFSPGSGDELSDRLPATPLRRIV